MWPFSSAPQTAADSQPSSASCPVDHETRAEWSKQQQQPPQHHSNPVSNPLARHLSTEREVSSIPRWLPTAAAAGEPAAATTSSLPAEGAPPAACPMHEANVNSAEQAATVPTEQNWVYPSPASFYTALERKQRNPRAEDMDIVVPIHNAVNERVWHQVLEWERAAMGIAPGQETGSRLVSFIGRPKQMSPRARWKSLIGYTAPFDRHDWIVDRPVHPPSSSSASSPATTTTDPTAADNTESIRVRYVIDFYTGRGKNLLLPPSPPASASASPGTSATESSATPTPTPEQMLVPNLAFYIDCRPALDGWEGLRMRFNKYWGLAPPPPPPSPSSPTASS
ncbi:hypothetical protein JCM3774_006394 [Rhodotorula dairenensis]